MGYGHREREYGGNSWEKPAFREGGEEDFRRGKPDGGAFMREQDDNPGFQGMKRERSRSAEKEGVRHSY